MQEVKSLLRISYQTLHRLIATGVIPSVKIGRVIRIPTSSLEQFIFNKMSGDDSHEC